MVQNEHVGKNLIVLRMGSFFLVFLTYDRVLVLVLVKK